MGIVSRAEAQQGPSQGAPPEPEQSTVVITTMPNESLGFEGYPRSSLGYLDHELQELNQGIRNTRTALIATSALAGVGMIVAATSARHCEFVHHNFNQLDELRCTPRGDALLAAGASIFGLAAVGMITSGIILGVRKGKRRRLRREMRSQQGAHLQWNIDSARLEF